MPRAPFRFFSTAATALVAVVLSGHVTDRTTGQAMPGITVSAGSRHVKTDGAGAYRLTGLKAGSVKVTLTSEDVPPEEFSLVLRGAATHHDFSVCSVTLDYHCDSQ